MVSERTPSGLARPQTNLVADFGPTRARRSRTRHRSRRARSRDVIRSATVVAFDNASRSTNESTSWYESADEATSCTTAAESSPRDERSRRASCRDSSRRNDFAVRSKEGRGACGTVARNVAKGAARVAFPSGASTDAGTREGSLLAQSRAIGGEVTNAAGA